MRSLGPPAVPAHATAIEVVALDGREADWERYVECFPGASLYHRLAWRQVIQSSFGHRTHYQMAFEQNRVTGVLPLVEMKSCLFGHFMVSLPFFSYGGILADSAEATGALAAKAARLAIATGARHIELRQQAPCDIVWALRKHKVAMVLPLSGGRDDLWARLSSRLRGKVRKAARAGAQFSVGGAEAVGRFYRIFARNMRDLGTPTYPRHLLDSVLRILGDSAHVFLVHLNGVPVAGAIGLRHGDRLELPWICSHYGYGSYYVNEFLYWSAIEWACGQAVQSLDLGRSSIGSGPYRFKLQWQTREHPLFWYYWTAEGFSLPQLSPENPRYALAIRCWRKLPLAAANWLGPRIVRYIP